MQGAFQPRAGCAGHVKEKTMSSSTRTADDTPAPCVLHASQRHPRFVDLEEIGDGAYGSVRRCWDAAQCCTRAVKTFKEDAGSRDVSESCLREIAFQGFLTDAGAPGIVPLLDVLFGSEGQLSVLMPCLEMDVGRAIDEERFTSWQLCRPVLRDAFFALSYLHSFEPPLMHRDIKPENILLDPAGRAYLTDFGFMRFVHDGVSAKTRNLHCKGSNQKATRTYSAPEMLQEGATHDERADLWAMGVVSWELSRNARLEARTDRTARRNIKRLRETTWRQGTDDVSCLLMALLQEDPAQRICASAVLSLSALRLPESGMDCTPDRSMEGKMPPSVCAPERRGTPAPVQAAVAKCMQTLDYRMPQTFYAACAYVGDALESGLCVDVSSTLAFCAVVTAGKLYEHEYWDTAELAEAQDLEPSTLLSFQKRLAQHRHGRLLVPVPLSTDAYEAHLPTACAARKARRGRRHGTRDVNSNPTAEENATHAPRPDGARADAHPYGAAPSHPSTELDPSIGAPSRGEGPSSASAPPSPVAASALPPSEGV